MRSWLFTSLLLLISLPLAAQLPDSLTSSFDQEIHAIMAEYQAVGLAVAIVKEDQVMYSRGFGYRDAEKQLSATDSTVFHIASMSKSFTGALLGMLEAEGQLSLEDKPALYVPGFQFYNENMDNLITIEDLLSHRSGIGNQGSSIVMFPEEDKLATVQRLRYLPPEAEVKNSFSYSNLGYTLAGTIVEQVSGKSWEENVKERIFDPLGMHHSFTNVPEMEQTGNFSKGYARYQGETVEVPFENYYSWTPAGGIKSSVRDMSQWMRVWLNQGKIGEDPLIPPTYVREAISLQNRKEDVYEKDSYLYGEGFGWRLRAWNGHFRTRHGGNTNGFSTLMDLFPFEGMGIVVLSNQKSSLLPYAVSDYLSRKLLELPEFEFPVIVYDTYRSEVEEFSLNEAQLPTHELAAFVGTYTADGFGEIRVVMEEDRLFAQLPTYHFPLVHLRYNSFYMTGTEDFSGEFDPEFRLEFVLNGEGNISLLQLHSQKDPVKFFRE